MPVNPNQDTTLATWEKALYGAGFRLSVLQLALNDAMFY